MPSSRSLPVSLASLSLSPPPALTMRYPPIDIGAPKRKASAAPSEHYGMNVNSSAPVRLVAISRLVHAKDADIVATAANGPTGSALLSALKASVLRVAVAVGGADAALSESNVDALFNLSASAVQARHLYEGGLSLPSRIPHARAKALLGALLDALTKVRNTADGVRVGGALLTLPAPTAVDTTTVAVVIDAVETEMTARLTASGGGPASSSSASTRSSVSPLPLPVEATPFAIDPSLSLAANVVRLVAAALRRQLLPMEVTAIHDAIDTASGVLQEGDATTRRALLHSNVLTALTNPGAAFLWAASVERSEGGTESIEAFTTGIISSCSDVASVLFASAMGV
jgi:hypothetical protein